MVKVLIKILNILARRIIRRYEPDVIAITGSVGKTSAKEAIFSVMNGAFNPETGKKFYAWRSKGNFNNELGAPLAIISDFPEERLKLVSRQQPAGTKKLSKLWFWAKAVFRAFLWGYFPFRLPYPEILVLEYGVDRPGDMKNLLGLARPKIAAITAIGETPVHVEYYAGPDELAKEKGKILEPLSVGGFAVLNADDRRVLELKEKTRAKILTFGFSESADVKIFQFENRAADGRPEGISFKIEYQGNSVPVFLKNIFGRAHTYAAAAAFAVGAAYGLNLVEIGQLLEKNYAPAKRRMNLLEGIKETFVIDDSYNAAPLSVKEALEALKNLPAPRKIAVLGDMLELGEYSIEEHQKIGKLAAESADYLVAVGPRSKFTAESAWKAGLPKERIFVCETAVEAIPLVKEMMMPNDLILVKASRGIGLDQVVDEIIKTPGQG